MSTAGIYSNQGDYYQILVALDWAIKVWLDENYQSLTVDATSEDVDDIVVATKRNNICCQCKKNETNFKPWTIAGLGKELDRFIKTVATDDYSIVYFYSRSPVSELQKLQEFANLYPSETEYKANLTKEHQKTDAALNDKIQSLKCNISVFSFLQRARFETSKSLENMETDLRLAISAHTTQVDVAFDSLKSKIQKLGARITSEYEVVKHNLTKSDINNLLAERGVLRCPNFDEKQTIAEMRVLSQIGRSWKRDIQGEIINQSTVSELIDAIQTGSRSILLTGRPGQGKTCVMLSLLEELEIKNEADGYVPIFIQSREFSDATTNAKRREQGLPENWVEKLLRLSEKRRVILLVDSLDVLSIAKEHQILNYFLAQIDRLLSSSQVTLVASCRDFDRKYDSRLSDRSWDIEKTCADLDWDTQISPLLQKKHLTPDNLSEKTRALLMNPRMLSLYIDVCRGRGVQDVESVQALEKAYLEQVVSANSQYGSEAIQMLEHIASLMFENRSLNVSKTQVNLDNSIYNYLRSNQIITETHEAQLTFSHQTLLDLLVVQKARKSGMSLAGFIDNLPAVPFVRPTIRTYVNYLQADDIGQFRKEVFQVLSSDRPFHIKRLLAETFAEKLPEAADWIFLRQLFNQQYEIFRVIHTKASHSAWCEFWTTHLLPHIEYQENQDCLLDHLQTNWRWVNKHTKTILRSCLDAFNYSWVTKQQLLWVIENTLDDVELPNRVIPEYTKLVRQLIKIDLNEYSRLGKIIERGVLAEALTDDDLWDYITRDIDKNKSLFDNKPNLRCDAHEFNDENFLENRLRESVVLLDKVVETIKRWIDNEDALISNYTLLHESSFRFKHNKTNMHYHVDALTILLDALEKALLSHCENNSDWWKKNSLRLATSNIIVLQYCVTCACIKFPKDNAVVVHALCNKKLLESSIQYELGELIKQSFYLLKNEQQDDVLGNLLAIHTHREDYTKYPHYRKQQAGLIAKIPAYLRNREANNLYHELCSVTGIIQLEPEIFMHGGTVGAPFSYEVFLKASDYKVLKLLAYYENYDRDQSEDWLLGGKEEVGYQLETATTFSPSKFYTLLFNSHTGLDDYFCERILSGIASYLAYKHGNTQPPQNWELDNSVDSQSLSTDVLLFVQTHLNDWRHSRALAEFLRQSAEIVTEPVAISLLVNLSNSFLSLEEKRHNYSSMPNPLLSEALNSRLGRVAEGIIRLINRQLENGQELSNNLVSALNNYIELNYPPADAVLLRYLPYTISKNPTLGWFVFEKIIEREDMFWTHSGNCLYYNYIEDYTRVRGYLDKIKASHHDENFVVWGRISALCVMSDKLKLATLLDELDELNSEKAWSGAADVWCHKANFKNYREQCSFALARAFNSKHPTSVLEEFSRFFYVEKDEKPARLNTELVQKYFETLAVVENKQNRLLGISSWLNQTAEYDPNLALLAAENYLSFVDNYLEPYEVQDYEGNYSKMLQKLFIEAEAQETFDNGELLMRVAKLQDKLYKFGLEEVDEWLQDSERL